MSLISFADLPSEARLWIFNTDRLLTGDQITRLRASLDTFLEQWTAHRVDVPSGYQIQYNHFILIGADTRQSGTAGCSIDGMMSFLRTLQEQLGVIILDAPDVCFQGADGVDCVSRARFQELAAEGDVTASTTVFDNTVTSMGDYSSGAWEKPARDSWHARAFELKEVVM